MYFWFWGPVPLTFETLTHSYYCDMKQCCKAFTGSTPQNGPTNQVHAVLLWITLPFWAFALHVNPAPKQGKYSVGSSDTRGDGRTGKERRRGDGLRLLPPIKQSGEWQDSIHCKWATAMKSGRGRRGGAVKTLYIWCSSLLLKVDL